MARLLTPVTTKHLVLRHPQLTDLDDLALIYESAAVNRYLYSEPRDRMQTLAALERNVARTSEITEENIVIVAVELREGGRVVGDFMLKWNRDVHRQGEMGGSLHPDVHGRGFAAEIYHVLLGLAFDHYSLHRVVGRCDARNAASIRSLEKAGLHREAHLVENEFVKGEWTDEVILALREQEWDQVRHRGMP